MRYRYVHLLLVSERWETAAMQMEEALKQDPTDSGLRGALISLYTGPYPNAERRAFHENRLRQREESEEKGQERTGSPGQDETDADGAREENQS